MKPQQTYVVWDTKEQEIVIDLKHASICRDHIKDAMHIPELQSQAVGWVVRACIVHPGPPFCDQCGLSMVAHDKFLRCP